MTQQFYKFIFIFVQCNNQKFLAQDDFKPVNINYVISSDIGCEL